MDERTLQIDHISGNGKLEIMSFKNRTDYYCHVLENKENKYQLLCANCNWIKRYENKEA